MHCELLRCNNTLMQSREQDRHTVTPNLPRQRSLSPSFDLRKPLQWSAAVSAPSTRPTESCAIRHLRSFNVDGGTQTGSSTAKPKNEWIEGLYWVFSMTRSLERTLSGTRDSMALQQFLHSDSGATALDEHFVT